MMLSGFHTTSRFYPPYDILVCYMQSNLLVVPFDTYFIITESTNSLRDKDYDSKAYLYGLPG